MKSKLVRGLVASLCFVSAAHAQNHGQEWPNQQPIRLIAVFPRGGSVDQVTRILAPTLQTQLNQSVLVENIGGASGVFGTHALVKSPPDGYTFAVVFDTHGVNPSLKDKMPYDTRRDIATVTMIGTAPMVLTASKASGITSFKQLIEQSKAKKSFRYGSIGLGSLSHLSMALLAKENKFDWTHEPYRGGGPLMQDAVAGNVPLAIGSLFLVKPYIETNSIIPLAVTTKRRTAELPYVPTVAESGYPNFDAPAWWAVIAPAKTPQAIVDKMHAEIAKALKKPEVSTRLKSQGIEVLGLGPQSAQEFVNKQMAIWSQFVKENNIKEATH